MSGEITFVDTNVLVYSYDVDAGSKHETARSVLRELWESRSGAVSTQVLQEFYVTVTRKIPKPIPRRTAREIIETYAAWPVHRPLVRDVAQASELEERYQLSFWDSLIITSAQQTDARVLLSEDLQDGQRFGELSIVNPFSRSK